MTIQIPEQKLDAIEFSDKELTIVKLLGNRTYLVDGELYTTDYKGKQLGVANVDDIRLVSLTKVTKHYTNGVDTMTVEEYSDKCKQLSSKYNLEDECWNTLEDEFAYRKFVEIWQPVKEDVQTISNPIKVEVLKTVYDTGNPFILNNFLFSGGEKEASLFTYSRQRAIEDIVKNCFESLGMGYVGKLDYHDTKDKKVWSNSSHSGIRFLVAFGTYVFNKSWEVKQNIIGTLEDCQSYYEKDKQELEEIITTKYKEHFGKFDDNSFDYKALIDKLKCAEDYAREVDVKKGSQNNFNDLRRCLRQSVQLVINHLEE